MSYTPRSWQSIYAQIVAAKQAEADLNGLTSTSKAAYWSLWAFIVAVSQAFMEQRFGLLQTEIEDTVASAIPGTEAWIQATVLKFQAGNIIQVNSDFTFQYPDPQLPEIITSCAVEVSPSGSISIKVAKGGTTPVPLSGAEVTELTAYLDSILPAGQIPFIISTTADTLQIGSVANPTIVYYNGQYNSVIQANVIAALETFMTLLPFNGLIKVSAIEDAILAVPGVVDVKLSAVIATPSGGSAVPLISDVANPVFLARSYQTYAGYVENSIAPNDFASTITFQVAQQ